MLPCHGPSLREVRTGTEATMWKKARLLFCAALPQTRELTVWDVEQKPWRINAKLLTQAQAQFLKQSKTVCPGNCTAHSQLSPPMSITNQESFPKICPQGSLMESVPRLGFPLIW